MTAALIDLAHIENKIPAGTRKQKICFDEWNVWDPVRAYGPDGAEEKSVTNSQFPSQCFGAYECE